MDFYRICIDKKEEGKNMIKKNYISQVAGQMGASPSALRYWENREADFPEGKTDIGFRICNTTIEISEVLFYRSLSLPLEDMGDSPSGGEELEALLEMESGEIAEKDTGTGAVTEKN